MLRGVIAVAMTLVSGGNQPGQVPRSDSQIGPTALFSELLHSAALEEWDKVDRVVALLAETGVAPASGPLSGPARLMGERILARDRVGTVVALSRFIAVRTTDLVRRASREPSDALRRQLIRQAFAEFLTLTPVLKPASFQLHQQVESGFRTVYGLAGPGGPSFLASCDRLVTLLQRVGMAEGGPS